MTQQVIERWLTGALVLLVATAPVWSVAGEAKSGSIPIKVGDTDLTMTLGGFAKVDFIQDFDPIGNQDQFKVNTIPVEGTDEAEAGGANNISARQTRFSLDVRDGESPNQFRVYVEGDFFGSGNSFRMRHGYGVWKGLLGGQTWSTFQDITARPSTIDYEGPDSEIFVRQPMIRYTGRLADDVKWSIAVEDQNIQLTLPDGESGSGRSTMPDIPARIRIEPDWGHVQIAGIVRELKYVSDDGSLKPSTMGYGVNLSSKIRVGKKDAIMGHVAVGSGIGRYVESFGGTGSDGVLTENGDIKAIDSVSFVLGYTHAWSKKWKSTLSGGVASLDNLEEQAEDAIKATRSGHLNLIYAATRLVNLGGEIMFGERENKDGATGSATRFQFSVQYKFH